RLDHSIIFVFIGACYTPLAVLAMPPDIGTEVLTIVWTGAAAGSRGTDEVEHDIDAVDDVVDAVDDDVASVRRTGRRIDVNQ
ncbi:hypothetical protein C6A85_13140, partial [Mycobacterium sp. ITM-2017-0098]